MKMIFREACTSDIDAMSIVRMSVKENALNNPDLVTKKDYEEYLTVFGKGWLCEVDGKIAGFSIVGLTQNNIWALFVDPANEKRGIGRKLHQLMMDWYFEQTDEKVWLGTAQGTRAEQFYRKSGWTTAGMHGNEVKFEMTQAAWKAFNKK